MTSKVGAAEKKKSGYWGALLRWGLAIGMLVLVIRSGKLSASDLAWFSQSPGLALSFLCVIFFNSFLSVVRWIGLLGALNLRLGLWTAIKLTMTGSFFSSILPGTVGGDLVKAVFVARRFPKNEGRTIATLLIDRVCGLFAVLLMGTVAFIVGWRRIYAVPGTGAELVRSFGLLLCVLGVLIAISLLVFPLVAKWLPAKLPRWTSKIPKAHLLDQFYEALIDYQAKPFAIWRALGISMVIQSANMACYWFIAVRMFGPAPWGSIGLSEFVVSAVLALCAMQIPVAPMGLGIGQMAFSSVFFALGAPDDKFGTALVTSVQVLQLFVNMTGALFFASYRHDVESSPLEAPDLKKSLG